VAAIHLESETSRAVTLVDREDVETLRVAIASSIEIDCPDVDISLSEFDYQPGPRGREVHSTILADNWSD